MSFEENHLLKDLHIWIIQHSIKILLHVRAEEFFFYIRQVGCIYFDYDGPDRLSSHSGPQPPVDPPIKKGEKNSMHTKRKRARS